MIVDAFMHRVARREPIARGQIDSRLSFAHSLAPRLRRRTYSPTNAQANIAASVSESRLPPPRAGYYESLPGGQRAMLDQVLACSALGTRDDVASGLAALLARTGADEVIVGCQMFDHAARRHSFAIAAEAMKSVVMAEG